MRFVPKFHKSLIIKVSLVTIIYCVLALLIFFSGEYEDNFGVFFIQLTGVYVLTLLYFVITWLILNLIEINHVYEAENENYYRDMIKNISPAQLSYIDDYGIENKKDIIATILMLHIKGNIKINNNNIEFISKYKLKEDEYYNLSKSEVAVLDCISKNKSPFQILNRFGNLLIEDLVENNFVEKENTTPPHFYVKMLFQFIFGILLIILANTIDNYIIKPILLAFGIIIIPSTLLWLAYIEGAFYTDDIKSVYKKLTPKGNEIRLKLTGLKAFLRDYSLMKSRELKEIELWDEYIIYSVILNDNKKVQKEIYKMVKSQFES